MSTNVGEIDLSLILNSDKFSSQLKNIDGQANTASSKISASLSKIGKAVAVAFSVTAITRFGKECLNVASETANAWIGLNSILTGQGKSFENAKSFINDYISDGLVPLNNAVAAYKNLALRGYNSEQIEKTMNALKNSATFARQSTYSLGDAVSLATEGLKNENSVVVDNAGVTKNVAKMWEDYAKSIGKTTNNLTQAEKIQAEVNGILEETKFQSNDASIYANTYSGKVAQLSTAFTSMKMAIGNVIQPIAKLFVPIITSATNAITKLFTSLAGLLSLFGLKADSVETVSSGIGDIAESANNTSSAVEGIGDSASSSAKKVEKSLAGFDKINKLDSSSSSGGSGSSGGGSTSNIVDSLDVSTVVQEDTTAFNGLIERAKELANIFKNGFDVSFGDTNFNGILGHLEKIKITIQDIFSNKDVQSSANSWLEVVTYSLGQGVGAIARIGVNIAEGLVGSIELYLTQNVDRIKSHITNMFDISSENISLSGNFSQALGEITDVFKGDDVKQIGANIIAMFSNPFMSGLEICSKFARDVNAILVQPIIDNVEKIKVTFENVSQPIEKVTGTLAEAFTYVGEKWNEVYDKYISPFMESLKVGLSDTFSKFLDVYNQYVVPFLDNMANSMGILWEEHLKPVVDKATEFIGSIIEAIKTLWENWLKPLVDWIVENIIPVLVPIFESIWKTITSVFGSIADTIGGIIDTFKGLINFVVGIFTGDWKKAWDGIKTFFTGIWDTIKGVVSTVWEYIKGYIQTAIDIVAGIIKMVLNAIKTVWDNIWSQIKTVVTNIWNGIKTGISNVINGIKNTITSVLNTIKNIWSNIWNELKTTVGNVFNGIWTTIKGVINLILGGIEKMVNGVINGINGMTSAMNKISFDVPDWVPSIGGKKFGFNMQKMKNISIPKLAEGGYVKANTPQLAMIGDNKHHGEIVAPEDKLENIYRKVLEENGGNSKVIELLQILIKVVTNKNFDCNLYLDSYEMSTRLERISNKRKFATNGG